MADNFVEIRIKASDTAKPDLDELRANLDELGAKVDTAKVDVDDEDAKLKLLDINARLAALNQKVANPKIKVAGAARAQLDAEKLSLEMDRLKAKSETSGKGGILGRLLFGAEGEAEGGEGGRGGAIGGISGALEAVPPLFAAIAVAAVPALVEVTGLVSGFAAAGVGVGAFAALALPAFDAVKGALKDTQAQLAKLSPDERGAVEGIRGLKDEFMKMSNAFQPAAFKVFNDALKIANKLLPDLKPFADSAAKALDGLLKGVDKFAGSTGFKDWLKQFQKLEGPSITAIGHGIGQVAIAIGKLLTTMSKKDVVHAINIAFEALSGTISAITWIVGRAMHQWDAWSNVIDDFRKGAVRAMHDVRVAFDDFRHANAVLAHDIASYFDEIRANIARWAADVGRDIMRVVHFFQQLPGKVRSSLSNLASMLFNIGKNAILGLVHGIESMFGAVESAVSRLAGLIPSAISHILGIFSPSRVTKRHGQMIAQGLIDGMDSMHGPVSTAAMRLARVATPSGYGHGGVMAGGGVANVHLYLDGGDQMILTAIAHAIRVRGGNVQKVLGH